MAIALALLVALLAPPAAADAVTGGVPLSNEWTSTRWVHPARKAPIRYLPAASARQIVSTHLLTEDGLPEVYVVLRGWTDPEGHGWFEIRIPMRPNGRVGWVRHSAVGPLYRVRTALIVDRPSRRATLYRRGRAIWSAPVGIGKPSTPTPAGRFWIREKFATHEARGLYGPVAFGSSDYSVLSEWPGGGVIGIHGTDEPALIPGRPSHGCIRLRNWEARQLYRLMPVGTPLLIGRAVDYLGESGLSPAARTPPRGR